MSAQKDIFNFDELMADPKTNPVKETDFEKTLAMVDPEDAAAEDLEHVKFSFVDLLTKDDFDKVSANKVEASRRMMLDHDIVLSLGSNILDKMNATSSALLKNQRSMTLKEPDALITDVMRLLDGQEAKYQSLLSKGEQDGLMSKIKGWFAKNSYDISTFVRDSQPIDSKLDMVSAELKEIENSLALNVSNTKKLHEETVKQLKEVTRVLGGLEILIESAKEQAAELDNLILEAEAKYGDEDGLAVVEFNGEKLPLQDVKNTYALYAAGIDEMQKTWFDWRQQFFLGYTQAPSLMNISLVSNTLRRRCGVFRTMGIPAARRSLVMWMNALSTSEGAEKGMIIQQGLDSIVEKSMKATGDAVVAAAKASQAPLISRETVDSMYNSFKVMGEGVVEAARWGNEQRELTLQDMEVAERGISSSFIESRRELINMSINKAREGVKAVPAVDKEAILSSELGI